MRSRTIDLDGPLHYVDFGGSGPALVCVHGLGGSHVNWLAVGPALARHGRVVALDLPGFGRTPLAHRSADVRANRALLDRFLEAVVGEPAVLIGNSMGGAISFLEAAARPERVAGLVLVDPALPMPLSASPGRRVLVLFATATLPSLGEFVLRARRRALGPDRLVRETLELCCADSSRVPASVVDASMALARERVGTPGVEAAFLQASRSLVGLLARRRRCYDALRAVASPTLVVHGTRDRLVPVAAAHQVARLRPDWRFELLEGVGHVPQLEVPDRFVGLVAEWLEGALGTPAVASASA